MLPKLNPATRQIAMGVALGVGIGFDILLGAWTFDLAQVNCARVNVLSTAQQQATQRALNSLPTIAYYHEHPGELKVAERELRRDIHAFAAQKCTLF